MVGKNNTATRPLKLEITTSIVSTTKQWIVFSIVIGTNQNENQDQNVPS